MGFLEDIHTGSRGLRFAPKGRLRVVEENNNNATLEDLEREAALVLFHGRLPAGLRPEHPAQARAARAGVCPKGLHRPVYRRSARPC